MKLRPSRRCRPHPKILRSFLMVSSRSEFRQRLDSIETSQIRANSS